MRYIGSKASTAPNVLKIIAQHQESGLFCDPFGGIGVLGSCFKRNGFRVWTGDILRNAHNFQVARIQRQTQCEFRRLRDYLRVNDRESLVRFLNSLTSYGSWFEREYSQNRQFFTPENAQRIAACQQEIKHWHRLGLLTDDEESILAASLVDSMDKVANTAGTYYAYLKQWYRKSLRPFVFSILQPTPGLNGCRAFLCDAIELVQKAPVDVLYLDPPYNGRSYGAYYHLPETIAERRTPRVYGASGIPKKVVPPSPYNCQTKAVGELERLLNAASFKLLAIHYADDGLISPSILRSILKPIGRVKEYELTSVGYTTTKKSRSVRHRLYLVHNGS